MSRESEDLVRRIRETLAQERQKIASSSDKPGTQVSFGDDQWLASAKDGTVTFTGNSDLCAALQRMYGGNVQGNVWTSQYPYHEGVVKFIKDYLGGWRPGNTPGPGGPPPPVVPPIVRPPFPGLFPGHRRRS